MTFSFDLVSRIIVSGAYYLYEYSPNLVCGFSLGMTESAYHIGSL